MAKQTHGIPPVFAPYVIGQNVNVILGQTDGRAQGAFHGQIEEKLTRQPKNSSFGFEMCLVAKH